MPFPIKVQKTFSTIARPTHQCPYALTPKPLRCDLRKSSRFALAPKAAVTGLLSNTGTYHYLAMRVLANENAWRKMATCVGSG